MADLLISSFPPTAAIRARTCVETTDAAP